MTYYAFEFIRVFLFLLCAFGVLHLSIINRREKLALIAISFQFFMRAFLLAVQIITPEEYKEINNFVATPITAIMLLCIMINVYRVRTD